MRNQELTETRKSQIGTIFFIGRTNGYGKETIRKALEARYQRQMKNFDAMMLADAREYVKVWRPLPNCSLDDLVMWRDRAYERCQVRPLAAARYMTLAEAGRYIHGIPCPKDLDKQQRSDARWISKLNNLIACKLVPIVRGVGACTDELQAILNHSTNVPNILHGREQG